MKVRAIKRFLADGDKTRLVIVFRGREIVHPETGKTVLLKVLSALTEYAVVEQMPLMDNRRMTMLIAPKPGVIIPVKKKGEESKETARESATPSEDTDTKAASDPIAEGEQPVLSV